MTGPTPSVTLCGMIRRALLPALLIAALAGCSHGAPRPAAAPTASPAPASSPSPTASPPPTGPAVHAFGQDVASPQHIVTAFGYRQPTGTGAPPPDQAGYVWASVDAKICATTQALTIADDPWSLTYDDATQIRPSSVGYRQFQQPTYPWAEQQLVPGRCVRGWITYAVPRDRRPVMVEYQPEGDPAVGWRVT